MQEGKPLILIVDDDRGMAQFNSHLLERRGNSTFVAHTSAQAHSFVLENKPDMYVIDFELPDGDGISLCHYLRQISDAPILFMTGRSKTTDIVLGLRAGGDYFLAKPYKKKEFIAVVTSLLRRAELTRKKTVSHLSKSQ